MNTSRKSFGQVDGREVDLFTLENDHGMEVKITNYGGIVTSIVVPDKAGGRSGIVCGFDTLEGYFSEAYRANSPYFGCLVGRHAGRIKDGRFTVGGQTHQLATNDGTNHLHGGIKGYDKRVWDARIVENDADAVLELSLLGTDGEEGYPGNVKITVEYRLNDDNELRIHYGAETDKATPITLTNHTYLNLNGFQDKILDHVVQLSSDRYLVPDETNVPVGKEAMVAGTACNFNQPRRVGDSFSELPLGFEHYFVFGPSGGQLRKVAEVNEPTTGRRLEVLTTEPGALFYTGRYTSDELKREDGTQFGQFRAFCLETSKYPNGPNIDGAPACVLAPGDRYEETTVYRLGWG